MKKTGAALSLLCLALALNGCKAPEATQTTDPSAGARENDRGSEYNRGYERESRRHHHHGHEGREADDGWTSYDRDGKEAADRGYGDDDTQRLRSGRHNSHAVSSSPGHFDFYLLNLSWSPEFCSSHPAAAECAQHRAFTLHGLWPQNNDGTYPEECSESNGPANPAQYADIYPDASLLQHEWQTHGTCSGLGPDAFLALARRAEQSVKIPEELARPSAQAMLSPDGIVTLLTRSNPSLPADSLGISCGNNSLTAVEVCLDRNLRPQSCSAIRSCRANQVRIVPPGK